MSCDPCDFERYINGEDTPTTQTIMGEWIELHFPINSMPITLGDSFESDPQHYMNIQFENGSPWFMIMKTAHEAGFRSNKDECVLRFEMPVELLERIARIGRS